MIRDFVTNMNSKKKKRKLLTNFGTINVRGCNTEEKLGNLAMDALNYNVKVLTVSETHIPIEEEMYEIQVENEQGKKAEYVFYTSNKDGNTHHGIGILIHKDLKPTFEKINERIAIATIKEKNIKISIIAIYAPTSSNCVKEPKLRDDFYEVLEGTIKRIPKRNFLVLAGDFNAKTGSGHHIYKDNMGKYGKGHINESGKALLELCSKYDLVITNTLFPHNLSHRTTWTAPEREYITYDGTVRRNPTRNQIDYVIIRNEHKHLLQDSRSYGGTQTDTDHKMVMSKIFLDTRKMYNRIKVTPKTNISAFADKTNREEYQQKVNEITIDENQNPQEKWTQISKICLEKGREALGEKTKYEKFKNFSS